MKRRVAILRTKGDILTSVDFGKFKIDQAVKNSDIFKNAKMFDKLGFIAESDSDYTIKEVIDVKNNPSAFMKLAFGMPISVKK